MSKAAEQRDPAGSRARPHAKGISVLIAAAHAVVRSGYRHMLEYDGGFSVVAEADHLDEALERVSALQPSVAILDAALPPAGGLEATRQLLERRVGIAVLVFAARAEGDLAMRALDAGAMGFLSQDSDRASVVAAARQVAQGRPFLEQSLMQEVALQRVSARGDALASLSPREFEIFRLLTAGRTVSEVAHALALSPRSVANYQTQIKRKLGVATTAELVHLAIRRGVIRVDAA